MMLCSEYTAICNAVYPYHQTIATKDIAHTNKTVERRHPVTTPTLSEQRVEGLIYNDWEKLRVQNSAE